MVVQRRYEKKHNTGKKYPLSVLLYEIENLCSNIQRGEFLDCTFGGGGYTLHLLKKTNSKIDAIDRDKKIKYIAEEIKENFQRDLDFLIKNLVK